MGSVVEVACAERTKLSKRAIGDFRETYLFSFWGEISGKYVWKVFVWVTDKSMYVICICYAMSESGTGLLKYLFSGLRANFGLERRSCGYKTGLMPHTIRVLLQTCPLCLHFQDLTQALCCRTISAVTSRLRIWILKSAEFFVKTVTGGLRMNLCNDYV